MTTRLLMYCEGCGEQTGVGESCACLRAKPDACRTLVSWKPDKAQYMECGRCEGFGRIESYGESTECVGCNGSGVVELA